ncbi:hypothetical protein D3Y59_02765 [Hymenobacter oligotrophus]|uniref:Uncharacterized protein n=1 Tax=Hymenobacter oligotrophus TaxID=2319843 RepID=A0A3B7QXW5_9BACT|nr:hypothetical protein [Hymenobacter oligotrophus]AYA36073.1 hypothetical protein D3Y59_02765 [Hymenobacter oligotrophus]
MNAYEKTFFYASMALLFAAVVLHFLRLAEPNVVVLLLTSGMGLFGIDHLGYLGRLKARTTEPEADIRRLQAAG